MKSTWIDTPESLEKFCTRIRGETLAVDTESDHYHAYNARVCLIQVATAEQSALIDPLAIDERGLDPFFDLLHDREVVKIFHAARNDLIEIDRDYGIEVNNLFDTRVAARFLGYQKNSLSWLLEEIVGVKSGGNLQQFDWTTRPLPERALRYAADDVLYLSQLRQRFSRELRESEWWEPFAEYCEYVTESARHEPKAFDPEGWRGFKNSHKLDGRGRATLRDLFLWRHEECEEINRAAFMVLSKRAMISLAKERPETVEALRKVRGLPRSLTAEQEREIVEVIQRSLEGSVPPARLPRTSYSSRDPLEDTRFKALRKWRNKTSNETDLPGEYIATNATLSEIACDPPGSVEELDRFSDILGWHQRIFGQEIVTILAETESV